MTFDLDRYLRKIGLSADDITHDAAGLGRLQQAQMKAIAFENMDPLSGIVPSLDGDAVWQKLVVAGRGGYCLELNRLFGDALDALGFDARPVLGRVRMGAPEGGPRSHHAFVVKLAGIEYLADTGFGGPAPALPVRLGVTKTQTIGEATFRMRTDDAAGEEVIERLNGEQWFALYGFDRVPVRAADLEAANFVCARWEKSPFPVHLMMTIVTDTGRHSLFNRGLKSVHGNDKIEETTLETLVEFETAMMSLFRLPADRTLYKSIWDKLTDDEKIAA